MDLYYSLTEQGLKRFDFTDAFGSSCSIQQSGKADPPAIWLGCNHGTFNPATDSHCHCCTRMLLTREMVAALLPVLVHFLTSGEL